MDVATVGRGFWFHARVGTAYINWFLSKFLVLVLA